MPSPKIGQWSAGLPAWSIANVGQSSEFKSPESRTQSTLRTLRSLVALGDRFALASGLMEITYDTGAKVILQGPVTYEVESEAGGYLSLGKLTAKLEKRRKSESPNPNLLISIFTLHSPLSIIRRPHSHRHRDRPRHRVRRRGGPVGRHGVARLCRQGQSVGVGGQETDRKVARLPSARTSRCGWRSRPMPPGCRRWSSAAALPSRTVSSAPGNSQNWRSNRSWRPSAAGRRIAASYAKTRRW